MSYKKLTRPLAIDSGKRPPAFTPQHPIAHRPAWSSRATSARPVGPRIVQFDNASATEEAIFLDFNLQQEGEPFIVFKKPLTEDIDRRSLPTIDLDDVTIDSADIYTNDLVRGGSFALDNNAPTFGIVAEGVVELQIEGKSPQRIAAGASFSLPSANTKATFVNASSEVSAKVISFVLR